MSVDGLPERRVEETDAPGSSPFRQPVPMMGFDGILVLDTPFSSPNVSLMGQRGQEAAASAGGSEINEMDLSNFKLNPRFQRQLRSVGVDKFFPVQAQCFEKVREFPNYGVHISEDAVAQTNGNVVWRTTNVWVVRADANGRQSASKWLLRMYVVVLPYVQILPSTRDLGLKGLIVVPFTWLVLVLANRILCWHV